MNGNFFSRFWCAYSACYCWKAVDVPNGCPLDISQNSRRVLIDKNSVGVVCIFVVLKIPRKLIAISIRANDGKRQEGIKEKWWWWWRKNIKPQPQGCLKQRSKHGSPLQVFLIHGRTECVKTVNFSHINSKYIN